MAVNCASRTLAGKGIKAGGAFVAGAPGGGFTTETLGFSPGFPASLLGPSFELQLDIPKAAISERTNTVAITRRELQNFLTVMFFEDDILSLLHAMLL